MAQGPGRPVFVVVSQPALSVGRLVSMMKVQGVALALLVACTIAADPCDSTAPPEPGPAPSPTPAPPNPCDTTPSPAPAPTPAPTPGCDDKPADWKSTAGSTCADYVSKAWCTSDGGYGSGWDKSVDGSFDDWAVNGVAATVACCGCGGGSTVTGRQACQGHSYDKATCESVGCCRWNVLLGCRANDADAQCYSGNPCGTTVAPGPSPPGPGKKGVVGGVIAGAAALAVAGAIMGKSTTTAEPGTTGSGQTTQGVQTTAVTTTTENSSSSLLWLWILLGILALCCLLALCGGGLAACMGGKKKKKKSKRATRVSEPALAPVALPIVEEQQELLPMVPPLLEPSVMMPMAAPTMVETVQMVPTATPTMVETAVPMMQPMQMGVPAVSAMPMMESAMATPAAAMQGIGGFGTQAVSAMPVGGNAFATQSMPAVPYLM